MNNRSKKEILKQQTRAKFPYLIEITTPDNEVFRYNNTDEEIVYVDVDGVSKTFEPSFFYLTPPKENDGVISDTTISISAIDQEWIKRIRRFTNTRRCTIRYVGIIMFDDNGERYIDSCEDNTFFLSKAEWNDTLITWTMTLDDIMSIQIPCDTASPLNTTGAY